MFDAHANRLYRLARQLTSSADDAQDLVQETFLKIAESPGAIPSGIVNVEAWLVRVLVNIRRDQWRKEVVRRKINANARADAPAPQISNQETAFIARTTVWRALDTLHPRRRAVIVMHELEGMEISAIASILGIRAITARWHLSKGRHDLSKLLKPESGR